MLLKLVSRLLVWSSLIFLFCMIFVSPPACASNHPFPVYECLIPNVEFWKKVYTRYTTKQGIVHDNRDLSIVYEVVDLVERDSRGAQAINKHRIDRVKSKYQTILEKLAGGDSPSTSEEKRVVALFGPDAKGGEYREAQGNIRCQIGQMDRFRQGVIRSGAFLPEIRRIFRSYGLPEDLSYLPHVESSFDYSAYSKFGAAGMWQFTQGTGKRFMNVGYTVDERRDPIRSTHAAAQLLKLNYEALGNWPMAITAYNHGLAGMMRAKESKGTFEAVVNEYNGRAFKFASRNFYCEFLAALDVAKNYRGYFGELKLEKPVKTHEIVLTAYAPIADLARHLKVDVATLRKLNPSLRQPVFDGRKYVPKGFALRLPSAPVEPPETLLAELNKEVFKSAQKKSRFYSIRKGDTVTDIARAHGVSPSALILANNLDPKGTIYAGQNLRIPGTDEKPPRVVMAKAEVKTEISMPSPPESPPATPQQAKPKVKANPAKKASPPPPVIEAKAKEDKSPTNLALVTGDLLIQLVSTNEGKPVGMIRVEAEETLGHYADWLGISTQEIRRLNRYKYGKTLKLKEPVKIPLGKVSKEEFEEKRYEYHKELQEDFFSSYEITGVDTYTVKTGDSIWKLCREVFEVPFWLISQYNPELDFNKLSPSDSLAVPVVLAKENKVNGILQQGWGSAVLTE